MASAWERHVVPRIIKFGCGCELIAERRQQVVPHADGRVLELGIGGGLNLRFYDPTRVASVTGVDPSPQLRAYAERAPRAPGLAVEVRDGSAESLPFADASFDTVVTTFTLCSVDDPHRALAEARRVLRPGGQILFCEHGRAPEPGVARWQQRLDPLWKRVFGGCHLSRPVADNVARHFTVDRLDKGYMAKTPRVAGWTEWGRALAA